MKGFTAFLTAIFCLAQMNAQDCSLTFRAQILDKATNTPLGFSTLYSPEIKELFIADEQGLVEIKNVCQGEYHLEISHLACSPVHQYLEIRNDTLLKIYLEHHAELLDEVIVHGHLHESSTEFSNTVKQSEIKAEAYRNLSEIIERIPGVSSLRNGTASAKPVVHGLYGNRLSILNNGITQSGQQWGNDHAPEIDAFAADHISVIKGSASLAYQGSHLGSVVLIEPGPISSDPHLQSDLNYVFNTNGRGHTLNLSIENAASLFNYRMAGSIKHSGDKKAPDYFLGNTGQREKNISLQLDKQLNERRILKLYFSSFNAELGILRSSHISNLTDLEQAFTREEPFNTPDSFSDSISAPRQEVHHHLAKIEYQHFLNDEDYLRFSYGLQYNLRDEFDIRRSGRSDNPSLSLSQYSHAFESKLDKHLNNAWKMNTGIQFQFIDNANVAGTGILPLIPDYRSYYPGLFLIFQKQKDSWEYEYGMRIDYKRYEVRSISTTLPREVLRSSHNFFNHAVSGGVKYQFSRDLKFGVNAGMVTRDPAINELYSNGLHQRVSGIEEGDSELEQEYSYKILAKIDWSGADRFFIQSITYLQYVNNYIYLQPENMFRLTIRGAFPVFKYRQTDARIWGSDFLASFQAFKQLRLVSKASLIRGRDLDNHLGLINIPADNASIEFQYAFGKASDRFYGNYFNLKLVWTGRQNRIDESQDFLAPPESYSLLSAKTGTHIKFHNSILEISLFADNLLNTQYRDYLNRLRYFADELGFNAGLRLNLKWES